MRASPTHHSCKRNVEAFLTFLSYCFTSHLHSSPVGSAFSAFLRPCSRPLPFFIPGYHLLWPELLIPSLAFLLGPSLAPLPSALHIPARAAFLKHRQGALHMESLIFLQPRPSPAHDHFHVGSGRRPVVRKGEGNARRDLGDLQSPSRLTGCAPNQPFLVIPLNPVDDPGGSKRVGMRNG